MDQSSIAEAVKQICDEKKIPVESVIQTIEAALAAAYRKDFGEKNQNIKVEFDLETGGSKIFDIKTVVEDVPEEELLAQAAAEAEQKENKESLEKPAKKSEKENLNKDNIEPEEEIKHFNPKTDIQLSDAQKIKKNYKIGDEIKTQLEVPGDFGRMAAQTAKQVIVQKLRETEREALYEEFKDKQGEILLGTVQRREGYMVLIDLGRLTALLPPEEQIRSENYSPGSHIKVYVISVTETTKGPEIIVSRAHPEIVRKLFFLEIPEIASGVVEVKAIAREAGSRSKIAVWTDQENIDPIGSCIGQRGARIQTIISELKGEKVDIIKYSDNPAEYVANALSPAKITGIEINEKEKVATAVVAEDQLSLAIGKAGQNVRLAARLTGWKIDIKSSGVKKADEDKKELDKENPEESEPAKTDKEPASPNADQDEKKIEETNNDEKGKLKKKDKPEDKEDKKKKEKKKPVKTSLKKDKERKEDTPKSKEKKSSGDKKEKSEEIKEEEE
ncbi:transcription termination/antitermination protein NusA [Candidatus Falkowbacteria bacterium]|nr:transcription termination/antitermination protein NusA [Candidatus Falkowbacteria bacterium]